MSLDWSAVKTLSIPVGGTARDVKCVSVGGVEVWRKLPYDAEVEYIESTGTQYIDTGVAAENAGTVEIKFLPYSTGNYSTLMGARDGSSDTGSLQIRVGASARGGKVVYVGAFNNKNDIPFAYNAVNTLKVVAGSPDIVVNGTAITLPEYGQVTSSSHMMIPGLNNGNVVSQILKCRIYSVSLGGKIFQPVRVGTGANAVGCLYDRLGTGGQNPDGTARNDGLYFRQGTGAFVVGPDANAASLLSSAPSLSPLSLEPSLEPDADATESETQEETPQTD